MKTPTFTRPWDTPPLPKFLNRKNTIEYVGGKTVLEILETKYGLVPSEKRHRATFYSTEATDIACRAMRFGIPLSTHGSTQPSAILN